MRLVSAACVLMMAAPAWADPREPARSEALGVGVGELSGVSDGDTPFVITIHGEVGRPVLPTLRLVGALGVLVRVPDPDFEDGMQKPRSQGNLVAGARIEPVPFLSFSAVAGVGATDYVVDTNCNFLTGCDDVTETVFGLVAGAGARVVLVRRDGRWKDIGLEAHVTRAQYMSLGGVLTADVGLVFGRL
jgi:hypothetical protein